MTNGISPFRTDRQLVVFAGQFLRERVRHLRKDVAICLTPNKQGSHAYFPALMASFAFLELLSGLHAGKLNGVRLEDFCKYTNDFMNGTNYDRKKLAILLEVIRHKVAHLAHPYFVFDTKTSKHLCSPPMRLTWTVYERNRPQPIEVIPYRSARMIHKTATPWPVTYDHRVKIRAIITLTNPHTRRRLAS